MRFCPDLRIATCTQEINCRLSCREHPSMYVIVTAQAEKRLRANNRDYQNIIQCLETELTDLKRASSQCDPETAQRLAVLGCEVRKLEAARRNYRAVVERLLHFTRAAHMALVGETRAPGRSVANEADRVLQEVRDALQAQESEDDLPFGWEKAAALDGEPYYIK